MRLICLISQAGDLRSARSMFERVVRIEGAALGAEHPEVATPMRHLAAVMKDQGQLEAAQAMCDTNP